MSRLGVMLSLVALLGSAQCLAKTGQQIIRGGLSSMFTTWEISHEKEDGTGDDICIMEARGPGIPGEFAIRKDVAQSWFKQRILDPGMHFTYGQFSEANTVFDLDFANRSWHGEITGTGTVFDMRVPGGQMFDRYMGQLLSARSVGITIGSHVWTATIGEADKAYVALQDCIESVTTGDGRW